MPLIKEAPRALRVKYRSWGSHACSAHAPAAPSSPITTKAQCQFQREAIRPVTIRPVKPPMTVPVT